MTAETPPPAGDPTPPEAPGETRPGEVPAQKPGQHRARPRWRQRWADSRTRRFLTGFSRAGLTGALIFYCLSLTPSLLPRAWYLQAVMSAVTAAIGYGLGALVGWLLRSLIPWRPGPGHCRSSWPRPRPR